MRAALRFVVPLLAVGCSSSDAPALDATSVLRDLADVVIMPTLVQVDDRVAALTTDVTSLCGAPDAARLAKAQQSWRDVRQPWKRAEAFAFGPVMDLHVDGALDFWPMRGDVIEMALAATTPVDDALIDASASTAKGLPVIEYMLFDPLGDSAALTRLGVPRNCEYLVALGRDAGEQAHNLHAAWDPDFRGQLVEPGSATYSRTQDAVSAVIDALIAAAADMEGMKLAKPLGLRDGGVPQPATVESPRAKHSIDDLRANLDGVEAVYTTSLDGRRGASFADYVAQRSPDLDRSLRDRIAACRGALDAITPPLDAAVTADPASVQTAFECHKELLRLIQADLSATLAVTPTFTDNDAD